MTQKQIPYAPLDPGRIHAMNTVEFSYWCRELHCTARQLGEAVAQAGEHVTAVRQLLDERRAERDEAGG